MNGTHKQQRHSSAPPARAFHRALRREYAGVAATYDTRWAFYLAATTRETLARTAVMPGDRVLDVGCGTGVLLHQLRRRFSGVDVVGIDPVPEMLKVARRRLGPAVPLVAAWAEKLPFPAESFDVVVTCSALHYFRAPEMAIGEMTRVLRPGGWLVVTDWRRGTWTTPLILGYLRIRSRACSHIHHPRELRTLLEDARLADVRVARYRINWLWGLMTGTAAKPFW